MPPKLFSIDSAAQVKAKIFETMPRIYHPLAKEHPDLTSLNYITIGKSK